MKRRDFLKLAGGLVAATVAAPVVAPLYIPAERLDMGVPRLIVPPAGPKVIEVEDEFGIRFNAVPSVNLGPRDVFFYADLNTRAVPFVYWSLQGRSGFTARELDAAWGDAMTRFRRFYQGEFVPDEHRLPVQPASTAVLGHRRLDDQPRRLADALVRLRPDGELGGHALPDRRG